MFIGVCLIVLHSALLFNNNWPQTYGPAPQNYLPNKLVMKYCYVEKAVIVWLSHKANVKQLILLDMHSKFLSS